MFVCRASQAAWLQRTSYCSSSAFYKLAALHSRSRSLLQYRPCTTRGSWKTQKSFTACSSTLCTNMQDHKWYCKTHIFIVQLKQWIMNLNNFACVSVTCGTHCACSDVEAAGSSEIWNQLWFCEKTSRSYGLQRTGSSVRLWMCHFWSNFLSWQMLVFCNILFCCLFFS